MKYLGDIALLHFLHLPLKNKKEIKGKLSYQIIFFLGIIGNSLRMNPMIQILI